jgi:copper homeostasis protein CutC
VHNLVEAAVVQLDLKVLKELKVLLVVVVVAQEQVVLDLKVLKELKELKGQLVSLAHKELSD